MKRYRHLLHAITFSAVAAFGQEPAKPILYNHLEGDGSFDLDRSIRDAYSPKYAIVNALKSDGYAEPVPVSGQMPKPPKNELGQQMAGYVLVAYVVTAGGFVAEPKVLKSSNEQLSRACLQAMLGWRFKPAAIREVPVATTAAQEFNFGPVDASNGYMRARIAVSQTQDILVKRMPPPAPVSAYVAQLEAVTHNFFVGATRPETLHIVVVTRPGHRVRVWLVSSARPGDSGELEPLRKLLEAVPALDACGGPFVLALSGRIAGGDGREVLEGDDYRFPVPAEWRELARARADPPPFSSDAFLELAWPDPH